jgi:hypothetical protein
MACFGGGYYLGLNVRAPRHEDFLVGVEKVFSSIEVAHRFFSEMPTPRKENPYISPQ